MARTRREGTQPDAVPGERSRQRGIAGVDEPWRAALRMAWQAHCSGNVGVGSVLTDGTSAIVATGRNRVLDAEAPPGRAHSTYLAHAEMDVLVQLPQGDYPEHTLWSTLEPCLMCAAAVVLSHVGTVCYAADDPLWSGVERLPALNAQVARRWPVRRGRLPGPIGAWCGLLPLVWAIRRRREGAVARAYAEHDPALLALGRRVVTEGVLDDPLEATVEDVLERLWPELCEVSEAGRR